MRPEHWPAVREIYREGIESGNATFETNIPDWEKWDSSHRKDCRVIALDRDRVVGWAALSPVSQRPVYKGVAEVSVYVAAAVRGQHFGRKLLEALVHQSEAAGIWTLQAGIFPENSASRALHKACGFREVGVRHKIAQLHGIWRDVLLLERRSPTVR
jgi:phosphinothricin acetyltransferase